ncbi:MAG TPA: hypothetical protein DCL77_15385 [Prolixibacteraceae bacterium]|jgi:hypothetical protein|nr:hypothetical protein [Prolixibacteraceae bacterium]
MKNILSKIFKFTNVNLPAPVKIAFAERFGESLNVEWLQTDDFYEAIFYLEEIEHIARFDSTGKILNLKKNLSIHAIPLHIKEKAAKHGELMNVIEIIEEEVVGYELIVRDESLIRFSLLLNEKGGLIHKNKL